MLARYACDLYNHQAGQLSRYFYFAFLKRKVLQGLNRFKDESGMTPCGKLDSRLVFFPLQNTVHSASLDVSLLGKFYLHIYKYMQHQKMYIHIWVRLSMQFSRQEYWSGLPFPSPGDLPNLGIELGSPALAGRFFTVWATREAHVHIYSIPIYVLSVNWLFWYLYLCLYSYACMHAKSLRSCPTLCDPTVCSPSGSSVHGILQARILEWVAMPSSKGSSWPRDRTCISYASCIGRRVLYHAGATWEALYSYIYIYI